MTTVIALMYALIPDVSSAYWILSVMTTQVYLVVYLLMFVAAVRLRKTQPDVKRGYRAPALTFLCVMGFVASTLAFLIGFVPPSQFGDNSTGSYIVAHPERDRGDRAVAAAAAAVAPKAGLEAGGGGLMSEHDHRPVYYAIAGVLIVLTVIGLFTYASGSDDREAQDKAQQLTQEFEAAGLPVFASQDQITAALGNDGGAVCDDPTAGAAQGDLNALLYNGASFVGMRPVAGRPGDRARARR